jgi:hypothetical protein
MVRMPREGLSETGQIIAAVATAIILALLAKYGFLRDEDDGKKESESEDKGKTVINIQIGTQRIEEAARDGRDVLSPAKGTPLRIDASGVKEEPFEHLDVGALPIKNRRAAIMPGIDAHRLLRRPPTTMHLVVVLDSVYMTHGTQAMIGVYAEDHDDWHKLAVKRVGDLRKYLHFLVEVPIQWAATDASGRVRRLVVLCRTSDATIEPDNPTCLSFLHRAQVDASETYVLPANRPLTLFDVDSGNPNGSASLATITADVARLHVPAIFIPRGAHEMR